MNTVGQIVCKDALYPRWLVTRTGSGPDLWYAGNLELLGQAAVAVTGVRNPDEAVAERAVTLGRTIARQGLGLVSGCARGVDTLALRAAWEAGGWIIGCPAGSLVREIGQDMVRQQIASGRALFLSLYGNDEPFSPARAMLRNRLLMRLSQLVVVTASRHLEGGSYKGALEALRARTRWGIPLAALVEDTTLFGEQSSGQSCVAGSHDIVSGQRLASDVDGSDVSNSRAGDRIPADPKMAPTEQTLYATHVGPAGPETASGGTYRQPDRQPGQALQAREVFTGNVALVRAGALPLAWPLPQDFVQALPAWIADARTQWLTPAQPGLW
ncbi:MAG TPA: DNA-processing protein DprA [Spirochaetota bacterium]|nr:DNA-processing protein DprA [Spirochaetota bacterium]HPN83122.1 DNA-processing protein DprA [Spirochaetota bacterium]